MKHFFSRKKFFCLALILISIVLTMSVSAVATAEKQKRSEPYSERNGYGAYYDENEVKVKQRVIEVDSEKITLHYARTENLKECPVFKRADSYGTYDVYTDEKETEYLYLHNADIYCGFKMSTVGVATEKEKAVPQIYALDVANNYLRTVRDNCDEYKLMSCEYSELAGYYDIQYYLPIGGYKSDDIARIWVDAQGRITAFSEFNYKRYETVNFDSEKLTQADKTIAEMIVKAKQKVNAYIVDSYISVDDSGNLVLVKVVDSEIPDGESSVLQREVYVQPIK